MYNDTPARAIFVLYNAYGILIISVNFAEQHYRTGAKMENDRCCYVGTVAEFQKLNLDNWTAYMIRRFHQVYPDLPLDENENRG